MSGLKLILPPTPALAQGLFALYHPSCVHGKAAKELYFFFMEISCIIKQMPTMSADLDGIGGDTMWRSVFDNVLWVALGVGLALAAILIVHALRKRARSKSIAPDVAAATAAQPAASAEENWPNWETSIRNALLQHGWVEEFFLNSVPPSLRGAAMRQYVEEHADDALIFREEPPRIELADRGRMQTFLHSWKAAWELIDAPETYDHIVRDVATQICDVLGFVYVQDEQRIYRHLHGAVVRAPALRLKVPPRFPMVFIRRREGCAEDLTDLRSLMSILDMTSYFALIIDLNDFPDRLDPRKNLKTLVRDTIHDFIVLNGQDLRQILIARDPGKRLVEVILQQVDLSVVSPYVTSGPVPRSMFFGRDHELKTIARKISDTSFALIGGRKIGKTSILDRVYRLLCEARDPSRTLYLDCQSVTSHRAFYEAANTLWDAQPLIHSAEDFRRFVVVREHEAAGPPFTILLDEIDMLLNYDLAHGETLFSMFRALSQEKRCRFVFCGERVLNKQLHAPGSPMFNFCDVIHLGYLQEQAARRIILEPMQAMGISIQDQEEVLCGITRLSSCHPNLIQYLCQQLILEANARHSRQILPADLEEVRHSSAFQEYFLEVTWGNSSPLEQAITLLVIDRNSVTLSDLQDILEKHEFAVTQAQLEAAISGLRLYSILLKEGKRYCLASEVFGEIVHESQEVDILLTSLRNQMQFAGVPYASLAND